jgi:hypothetical protein
MAAAASTFTVHIANMAGEMIDIDDMSSSNKVAELKEKIAQKIGRLRDVIELTHMDDSEKGYTVLENHKRLGDYNIDYASDELKLVIKKTSYTGTPACDLFPIGNRKLQEIVPPNTKVVTELTPDMVDKIIYVLSEASSKTGIKCQIIEVGEYKKSAPTTGGPYVMVATASQKIVIEVILTSTVFSFSTIRTRSIHKYLKDGQVRLLIDPVEYNAVSSNSTSAAAQGGRRRKRSTKRKQCRRRHTYRKRCTHRK